MTKMIITLFQDRNEVFEQGFIVFSALLEKFQNKMKSNSFDFYTYISHALEQKNTPSLVRVACEVIGDLQINDCGQILIDNMKEYVPLLIKYLNDSETDKSVKVKCITALAETYYVAQDDFENMIEDTMSIINSVAEKCINPGQLDSDTMAYVKNLQAVLIEAYTIFLQDILDRCDRVKTCVGGDLEFIIKFLLSATDSKYSPTTVSQLNLTCID